MEGRKARYLATVKKSVSPVDSLKKVHIDHAETLEQLIPNAAVPGSLPVFGCTEKTVVRRSRRYSQSRLWDLSQKGENTGVMCIHCICKMCGGEIMEYGGCK